MWFIVIFLLVVIAVCAYVIFDINKAKNRFKKHSEDLQNEVLVMAEKENGLNDQVALLTDQIGTLKRQCDSVDQMIKLGFLTVEDRDITKKQIEAEIDKNRDDSNVIYIGRHA